MQRKDSIHTLVKCMPGPQRVNRLLWATLAPLALVACGSGADGGPTMALQVVEQGAHCGEQLPGLHWLVENGVELRLSMGTRPSGGYAITLVESEARWQDGAWTLWIDWREPAPEEIVTQALTTPCLRLRTEWSAPVALRVVDRGGVVRFSHRGAQPPAASERTE